MEMTSISKEELRWFRDRTDVYAKAIGRILVAIDYDAVSPERRLARVREIIQEAGL